MINTLLVNPNNSNEIFAGGLINVQFPSTYKSGLFKSIDSGVNWTEIGETTFNNEQEMLSAISIHPQNSDYMCVGSDNGIYTSFDSGENWELTNSDALDVNCIISTDNGIFAGTKNGLFISLDYGETWDEFNDGLGFSGINCMDYDSQNSILYVGTSGGGVYRYIFSDVTGLAEIDAHLTDFSLYQNYPNPFNPSTTIEYFVTEQANVKINLYNVTGELVSKLVNQTQEIGLYSIKWDGRDDSGNELSTGIYFYQMQVGKNIQTKKMILLR